MRLYWPTVDMLIEAPTWTPPVSLRLPPETFSSLGAFPEGAVTLDTDSLAVTGLGAPGVVFEQGPGQPEIAVFVFDGGGYVAEVFICGRRPAALLFRGAALLSGRIDARAAGRRAGGDGLGGWPGGGGGLGGAGGRSGGGGRGGGSCNAREALFPGSGGQSGASTGGLGGGGLQIGASGSLGLLDTRVLVDGCNGEPAERDTAGGGGSGGTLVLHGRSVRLDANTTLSARGGAGGAGNQSAHGGGGGAGGIIVGVSTERGVFDPNGAAFLVTGGPGGSSASMGKAGAAGETGIVFLSAKQPPSRTIPFRHAVPARELRPAGWQSRLRG